MDNKTEEGQVAALNEMQQMSVVDIVRERPLESARDVERRERALAVDQELLRWDRVIAVVFKGTYAELGITQEALAFGVGWTRNMVANLASGRRTMSVSELIMLAQALGVSPENLLSRILHWGKTSGG